MRTTILNLALALMTSVAATAQDTKSTPSSPMQADKHACIMADAGTWTDLGLNATQVTKVKAIQENCQKEHDGWLCPFGALQELTNNAAVALGIRQIAVPQAVHERLWVIKYTAFVGILALSFYSMHHALVVAEVEPFKTAISLRMWRAWPFVLFVLALLTASLFIERFYCRYLCPLGAGLAIPAKLKVFDWLKRRPQCGRECRLSETKCTVGPIDPLGRINANECVLCLRCQVIMNDGAACPVLKRRARAERGEA